MKKIYTIFFVFILVSCGVKETKKKFVVHHQDNTSTPSAVSQHSGAKSSFTKDDIKGVWTSGESENVSFSIGEDSILFVDAYEYLKYEFRKDTLIYIEDNVPFFKTRVIKADKDSLVTSNEDGIRRFWRFKD